jgi:hypothetical protein
MYVYNISDGVANIFYQSCAQIDNIWRGVETSIQKQDLAQTEDNIQSLR